MNLNALHPGESAVIEAVGGEGALRQHILDMGVIPGAEVTVMKLVWEGGGSVAGSAVRFVLSALGFGSVFGSVLRETGEDAAGGVRGVFGALRAAPASDV